MPTHREAHDALLDAARALLAAREDGMVTGEEWEALDRAVRASEAQQAQDQEPQR